MKKYEESNKDLEFLNIRTKDRKLIKDEKTIEEYDNLLLASKPLPKNIEKETKGEKELLKMDFNTDELPINVKTRPREIVDAKEISEIREYIRKHNVYPDGVKRTYRTDSLEGVGEVFLKEDELIHYQELYNYYEVSYKDEEVVDFQLQVKNTKSLDSIASSLLFFKTLTIVIIFLNVFAVLILFSLS